MTSQREVILHQARKQWVYPILSALALGGLILTRPMTALAVVAPFGIHGLVPDVPR